MRFYRIEGDVRYKKAGEFSWESAGPRVAMGIGDQVTLELSPCTASYALTSALHEILGEHGSAEVESTNVPLAVG